MSERRVVVVGAGLVGLATAYKMLLRRPGIAVTVLEKESAVGLHQSRHNSGVLHAGLYYSPGSLKARLAVDGIRQMSAFCQRYDIAHQICGKVVVAATAAEIPRLRELMERGRLNGLSQLEWLEPARIRELEPHAAGVAGIRVPEEGIADFPAVAARLSTEIQRRGGQVVTNAELSGLRRANPGWIAITGAAEFAADLLVNCAGLHADRVAILAGERPELRIVPFRGEYYLLRPDRQYLVRHLIYPVPHPAFPFLGVHFTRMIRGGVEAGPNAVLALAREGYGKRVVSPRDAIDALTFPGLWRFLARHPAMSWGELRRSFSKAVFCRALQRLVPEVRVDDLLRGDAGVRAQAMLPDGRLVQDFHFLTRANALHVLNAPSPGATAALAIGDEIERALPLG